MLSRELPRVLDGMSVLNIAGIDIETDPIVHDDTTKLWCMSMYLLDTAEVISVEFTDGILWSDLDNLISNISVRTALNPEGKLVALKKIRDVLSGVTKYTPVFHGIFDKKQLSKVCYIPRYLDTMLMAYNIMPPTVLGSRGDEDAMRFYSLKSLGEMGLCSKKIEWVHGFNSYHSDMLKYNQQDATSCAELCSKLLPALMADPLTRDAFIIDLCAQDVMIHKDGCLLDSDRVLSLTLELEQKQKELEERLRLAVPAVLEKKVVKVLYPKECVPATVGYKSSDIGKYVLVNKDHEFYYYKKIIPINLNSSAHVAYALCSVCNWSPDKFGKSGVPKTDKGVLTKLAQEHEWPKLLLQYRKLEKLLSTYLRPFQETDVVGRMHPSFLFTSTRSSRLSSRNPNFQNIPKDDRLRKLVICPPGYKIVCVDLSQIELRILGWYMAKVLDNVPSSRYLWNLYESGADVHDSNRVAMGLPPEDRKLAKIAIFLYIYGGGAFTLSEQVNVDMAKAMSILNNFQKEVPALPAFKRFIVNKAKQHGVLRTLYGHKIVLPALSNSRVKAEQLEAERQYVNYTIQGSQADIIKIIMRQVGLGLRELGASVLMQVHDELVFEVPEGNAGVLCDYIWPKTNNRVLLKGMPIEGVPGIGDSWHEAKEDGDRRADVIKELRKNKITALPESFFQIPLT